MRLILGTVVALAFPTLAGAQVNGLPTASTPAVDRLLAAIEETYRAKDAARFVALAGGRVRRQTLYSDYATFRGELAAAQEAGSAPAPGRRIDIGGRRMHINCIGSGGPTLVVDPGAGNSSAHWVHLHERLAAGSRVCLYDRAGVGWSDPSPAPATAERAARDLARLLETADEAGPFLLVGHSYGGYVDRVFHELRPERVAGIVLVESGHPEQWTRLPPPLTQITKAAVPDLRAYAAALRRGDNVPSQPVDAGFTDAAQRRLLEEFARQPGQYEELANVIEMIDSSTAQVRRAGSLGQLPLVVITARRSFDAFRHLPIDVAASDSTWQELQRELAGLSSCSLHVWSETGDHNIQVTDPDAVLRGIGIMVGALQASRSSGCPLTTAGR